MYKSFKSADASTNQLVNAYVTKRYPGPYNLGASLALMDASKAGVRSGAQSPETS